MTIIAMNSRYFTTEAQAAPTPCRNACARLVISVGTISSASASSAGRNEPKDESMIIGIANPTAPFTKPANKVNPAASATCQISRPNIASPRVVRRF